MKTGEPFLYMKTIPPQIREERVERKRLLRKLEKVFSFPLTLVCAPAGYGKTTILVEWLEKAPAPVVWLALSREENDALRFLNYFILAVQSVEPEMGRSVQATMNMPGTVPLENCLHLLVNELANLSTPMALVMDDFHELDSAEVQKILAHLVEHLPPRLHLVIATRVEPALPLARLRAKGMIHEIRTHDLCFRREEINDFFRQVMDLPVLEKTCRRLEKQTEGWVAALQLAALSMREGKDDLLELPSLAGQHYIFDYLAEEVLQRQPLEIREFLLCTSILEELSGTLCDALVAPFSPYKSGAECLEALEHANLFTQALDEGHNWYRYHALFRDFLQNQLSQTHPEKAADLHRKASIWLAENDLPEVAFRQAILAGDLTQGIQLVETQAKILENRGELGVLEQWLKKLPEQTILSRAQLCLASSWIAFCRLDTQSVRKFLDRAETLLEDSVDDDALGELLAARAFLAGMMDRAEETTRLNEQAVNYLRDEKSYLYCLLKLNQAMPIMMSGNMQTAVSIMEEAVNYARNTGNHFIALLGMRLLGEAYIIQGRLSWAENLFLQATEMIIKHLGERSPLIGVARMGLGEIYHQRNQLIEAERELEDGIRQVVDWMPAIVLDGLIWLSNTRHSEGDPSGAQKALQQAKKLSLTEGHPLIDEWMLDINIARIHILQGNIEEGLRWAKSKGLDLDQLSNLDDFYRENPVIFRIAAHITLARLFLGIGKHHKLASALEKSRKILDSTLPMCQEMGEITNLMEGLLIWAQVADCMGDEKTAQDCLHRALDLGATEHPIRIFLDEGESVIKLLEERRLMDLPSAEQNYLEQVLSAAIDANQNLAGKDLPVESLTFREMDVLRLIAEGKSNQEIADELILSLNTVKKHVSAIIDKLDAKNRSTAVIIARNKGLLE